MHVQPGYDWLLDGRMLGLAEELRHSTDAEDLTRVHERATATHIPPRTARDALDLVARLLIHTGRRMDELTTQDLLDYQAACRRKQREAVVLRFFEELSVEETARAMGCAEGTVKATVHQAIRALKEKLRQLA